MITYSNSNYTFRFRYKKKTSFIEKSRQKNFVFRLTQWLWIVRVYSCFCFSPRLCCCSPHHPHRSISSPYCSHHHPLDLLADMSGGLSWRWPEPGAGGGRLLTGGSPCGTWGGWEGRAEQLRYQWRHRLTDCQHYTLALHHSISPHYTGHFISYTHNNYITSLANIAASITAREESYPHTSEIIQIKMYRHIHIIT